MVIENNLQPSSTPLEVVITGGCTSTSSSVKMFELKQQAKPKF
jgi:hypothetical protein